jgi:hypothetical protein
LYLGIKLRVFRYRPAKVALSSLKILPGSENLMGIGGERESIEEINICEERRYQAEEVKVGK